MKLRPYQRRLIDVALQHLQDFPLASPLIVAPTASGKSVIVAELCVELGKACSGMVLVLTHRRELVEQNAAKLPEHINVGVYSAGLGKKELRRVTVAGFQSIRKQVGKLPKVSYILIDECFQADTLVETECGPVKISTLARLQMHPRVWCVNEGSGGKELDLPLRVWQSGVKDISLLTTSHGEIECTATHRFYSNGSWVRANQLRYRDQLYLLDSSSGFLKRLLRAAVAVVKSWSRQT